MVSCTSTFHIDDKSHDTYNVVFFNYIKNVEIGASKIFHHYYVVKPKANGLPITGKATEPQSATLISLS